MHRTRCLILHTGILLAAPLLAAGFTGAVEQRARGDSVTIGDKTVPRAPVGHRQPRASDIPADLPRTAADEEREKRDRELDRKLQICRGC